MGFIVKVFFRFNIFCIKKKEWLGMIKNIIVEIFILILNESW